MSYDRAGARHKTLRTLEPQGTSGCRSDPSEILAIAELSLTNHTDEGSEQMNCEVENEMSDRYMANKTSGVKLIKASCRVCGAQDSTTTSTEGECGHAILRRRKVFYIWLAIYRKL